MERFLSALLLGFGATCFAIPSAIVVFGMAPVGRFFAQLFGFDATALDLASVDGDSELRFYSVFFAAYGATVVRAGWRYPVRQAWVPPLALLFFAGGVARLLSYLALGAPHPLFVLLGAVELGLPWLILGLWAFGRRA